MSCSSSASWSIALDFTDVFSKGFAFEEMRGEVRLARGVARTEELAIDGAFDALDYTEETASGGGFWSRLFGG